MFGGTENIFGAYAESNAAITEPPKHIICLQYELVRQIYRDAEACCDFAENKVEQERLRQLLVSLTEAPALPTCFSKDASVRNMFIAALTWVYFHELRHLIQEHGYIRKVFGGCPEANLTIHECDVSGSVTLVGKPSAVSHTTEFSADFEAVNFCIMELIRHFTNKEYVGNDLTGEEFIGAMYLFVCRLSCVFYRFNGGKSLAPEREPSGSHPNPILRMELNLPHIIEILDMVAVRKLTGHNLDRKGLVNLYTQAAFSGAFFWLFRHGKEPVEPYHFLLNGLFNNSEARNYMRIIVKTWDEIESTIKTLRRFDIRYPPFGLLRFTDQFRENISSRDLD